MPQLVGITVHLTFACRAYELADWYWARGSKVVLGGLHVLSCPEGCAPHADALAIGDGVQVWPQILRDAQENRLQPRYIANYDNEYADDPLTEAFPSPTSRLLDQHQPHRYERLPQPLWFLLSGHRGLTYAISNA